MFVVASTSLIKDLAGVCGQYIWMCVRDSTKTYSVFDFCEFFFGVGNEENRQRSQKSDLGI